MWSAKLLIKLTKRVLSMFTKPYSYVVVHSEGQDLHGSLKTLCPVTVSSDVEYKTKSGEFVVARVQNILHSSSSVQLFVSPHVEDNDALTAADYLFGDLSQLLDTEVVDLLNNSKPGYTLRQLERLFSLRPHLVIHSDHATPPAFVQFLEFLGAINVQKVSLFSYNSSEKTNMLGVRLYMNSGMVDFKADWETSSVLKTYEVMGSLLYPLIKAGLADYITLDTSEASIDIDLSTTEKSIQSMTHVLELPSYGNIFDSSAVSEWGADLHDTYVNAKNQ